MKKLVFLIIFSTGVCYSQTHNFVAPLYPGAIQSGSHYPGEFLSKDSFEEVKSYYTNDHGAPQTDEPRGRVGKYAFFRYTPMRAGRLDFEMGATIETERNRNSIANRVLEKFEGAANAGFIDRSEYNRIYKKYKHLKYSFYPLVLDPSTGERVAKEEVIYKKYEDKEKDDFVITEEEAVDHQAVFQQMMNEGRVQEAAEYMARVSQQAHEESTTYARDVQDGKTLELWKDCLRELDQNAYKVMIKIGIEGYQPGPEGF